MGVVQKVYGFAVFAATCMLVFSHPKLQDGRRDGRLQHISGLHRRSVDASDETGALVASTSDDSETASVMWGSLVITGLITMALVLVLALCTCGKKSKSTNQASSPDEEVTPEENSEVTQQPVGNGPSSPIVMTMDSETTPRTPSPEMRSREPSFTPGTSPSNHGNGATVTVQMNCPPSPNFDLDEIPYADASGSPQHQPQRSQTLNRRLPQLPHSPPPAVPDGADKDKDYDLMYDVIPEKRKRSTPTDDFYDKGGGYERLRDTKANGPVMPPPPIDHVEAPYAKVNEERKKKTAVHVQETTDHNYNSIEETRGDRGKRSPPLAKPDMEFDGHYASVGEDEKDGPYSRVEDRARDGPYSRVEDRARDAPYSRVEDRARDAPYSRVEDRKDGPYARVEKDAPYSRVEDRTRDAPYSRVEDRTREGIDRSNGYASVRDVQNGPGSPPTDLKSGGAAASRVSPLASRHSVERGAENEEEDDDDVPPAIPEKLPDLECGMEKPMTPANHVQRLPSVGDSPGPSPHVERTSPVPPGSPQLINSHAGLAASIAAGTAAVANDLSTDQSNTTPQASNVQVKEKPYTQVSARESLEFVRARQQAEHTSRVAHYEFVNENENDYDGIYETVNEGQMSPQPERPPPLPNNRTPQVASPQAAGWQQAPIARPLYEEISDADRPQPPAGATAAAAVAVPEEDDMQPYAVTQKTVRSQSARAPQRSAPNTTTGSMYAQVDKDRGGSLKTTSELYSQVKRQPGGSVRVSGNQNVARSKVESPLSPPGHTLTSSPIPPGDNVDELYAKVEKKPSLDGSQRRVNGSEGHGGVTMGSSPPGVMMGSSPPGAMMGSSPPGAMMGSSPPGGIMGSSPPEGAGHDRSYQSIDEVMNDEANQNGGGAAELVLVNQNSNSQRKWKHKEHTYQAIDNNNMKKTKKEKKKDKKDHQNNKTPSPQPQANLWVRRDPQPQNSGYEPVNVNNVPVLQSVDNANKKPRSRTNSREQMRVNGLGNQDARIPMNSRESIRANGVVPQQQGNRSRTNSREPAAQDTRGLGQENGNNNCGGQGEYFWPGYVQETRL